jgi:hypothetical protein
MTTKPFQRPPQPPQIVLQPRDLEIFRILLEHRLMSQEQLVALFAHTLKDVPSHISRLNGRANTGQAIERRLRRLWQAGYLDRLISPIITMSDGVPQPQVRLVYTVAPASLSIVAETTGEKPDRIRWVMKRDQVSGPYIQHALKISEFYVALTLALRPRPHPQLIYWRQGREIHSRFAPGPGNTIRPDALCVLTGADGTPQGLFIEMDNATIREAKMLERYRRYWQFWKAHGHARFKLDSFRVLTICPTPTRAHNLRAVARQADDHQRGSGMFLFTHQQWSASDPSPILKQVWYSPKDTNPVSLLEF